MSLELAHIIKIPVQGGLSKGERVDKEIEQLLSTHNGQTEDFHTATGNRVGPERAPHKGPGAFVWRRRAKIRFRIERLRLLGHNGPFFPGTPTVPLTQILNDDSGSNGHPCIPHKFRISNSTQQD